MMGSLRRSMAWLHVWLGLVAGWLLFAVFLTGTVSYYRPEITLWMQPDIAPAAAVPDMQASARALERLEQVGAGARRWLIELPDDRLPLTQILVWRDPGTGPGFQREALIPGTGRPAALRASHGADFLYYFHFDLRAPGVWGRYLVGLAAVAMLVTIVSGVIVHRRIFADFFTFRPGKVPPRAWLDAHNAAGVLALPFHLMITYSGLVTLMTLYLPWGLLAAYDGDSPRFQAEAFLAAPIPPASGRPAPLTALEPVIAAAEAHWREQGIGAPPAGGQSYGGAPPAGGQSYGGAPPAGGQSYGGAPPAGGARVGRIDIYRPGDANAVIELTAADQDHIPYGRGRITFDGRDGRLLASDDALPAPAAVRDGLYGLHIARFAGPGLRLLFFVSGLAGTGMVASGLILWVVKRRPRPGGVADFGWRLAAALNRAMILGLPIGIAGFFWANRLLPLDLPQRANAEVTGFFGSWLAAMLLAAGVARWQPLLWLAALLYLGLPLLNVLTSTAHLGVTLARHDWARAGFDLVMPAFGLMFAALAWRLDRHRPATLRGGDPVVAE